MFAKLYRGWKIQENGLQSRARVKSPGKIGKRGPDRAGNIHGSATLGGTSVTSFRRAEKGTIRTDERLHAVLL